MPFLVLYQMDKIQSTTTTDSVCPLNFNIPLVFISADSTTKHTTLLHNRIVNRIYYKCAADMKVGWIVGGFANDFIQKHICHTTSAPRR